MRKINVLELSKKGTDFGFKVPAGTDVSDIEEALALFIIDCSKYRKIKSSTMLSEIEIWVKQLEERL